MLIADRNRGAAARVGPGRHLASHGEAHRDLHERRSGEAALLRAGHTHLGEDAEVIGAALNRNQESSDACRDNSLLRYSSACGRGFVCFVLGPFPLTGSKTKHTKHLPQADE